MMMKLVLFLPAFALAAAGDEALTELQILAKMEKLSNDFNKYREASAQEQTALSRTIDQKQKVLRQKIDDLEHLETMQQSRRLDDITATVASTAAQAGELATATDTIWLLLCGSLVMFMQAGFAMVESGCCRAKNVQNILMKNLVDVCGGTICWWAIGWPLAYGISDGDNDAFVNSNEFFATTFTDVDKDGNFTPSDKMRNWFFQWTFASAAATIVSGGVAERVQFPAYIIFTAVMSCWIYPVVVHWTWGYGWLSGGDDYQINSTGFMDFAGSGIVHMCGGVGALVGATVVGPRKGRFDPACAEDFQSHSLPLIVLGTFVLWFGWYGFNCGSTLAMSTAAQGTMAAQVAMNTTLSGAAGGLGVLAMRFIIFRKYDIGGMCNGILAGLVGITAGCANVECGSAFAIGSVSSIVYVSVSKLLEKLQIDDPIDAFPVHGACGAWGVLAAALFDFGTGMDHFNGWSGWNCVSTVKDGQTVCTDGAWTEAFAANCAEIASVCVWTATFAFLTFWPLMRLGILRTPDDVQDAGLDAVKHSPSKAYSVGEDM